MWYGVDPLADHPNQVDKSPYSAIWNNPIRFIDPDGRCPNCPPPGRVIGIFYHGGPTGAGKTTTPAKAGGTGEFYNTAKSYATASGREFVGTVIAPGFTSASGVENGLIFINQNLKDGDQVIICGYSYGVDVAVDLSTQL